MPNYNYRCPNCEAMTILTHGMNEKPEQICIMCGYTMKKLMSATPTIFKCKGFYKTDYVDSQKEK